MGGTTVCTLFDEEWVARTTPARPDRANFVVVCPRGDWSRFMTLAQAKETAKTLAGLNRPDGYFWIEER